MFWFFEREWLGFTFARILYCEAGTQSKWAPRGTFCSSRLTGERSEEVPMGGGELAPKRGERSD